MTSFGADDGRLVTRFETSGPVDLRLTLRPLQHGSGDPTIRFTHDGAWLTRRTVEGPATLHLREETTAGGGRARAAAGSADCPTPLGATVVAEAWGPGAELALDATPALIGLLDEPGLLISEHPLVRELVRRMPGFRMTRTGQLIPALLPAVLGQKVTATEMIRGYGAVLLRLGEPAPGPGAAMGLRVCPRGAQLAALPYFEFHPMGIERHRADLIRRLGGREAALEALMSRGPAEASERLRTVPGVGPWTAAETTRIAFGDPDAVSIGDAHIPDLVAWALANEPRADDARMLELLEPYRGQRARVVALLEAAGIRISRFGPRFSPRRIERI